jgi:hypothetical protein
LKAYYLRTLILFSYISHYTALQKFAARITGTMLERIISSLILLLSITRLFIGIGSSELKAINASQYYTDKDKRRKKYVKLSVSSDMLFQLICVVEIIGLPIRHETIDFQPLINASEVLLIAITVADKGYDTEDNHILVRVRIRAFSIIPAR